MFEEYTFDYIMSEMLSCGTDDGVDTSEGSIYYNACQKQALKLEETYINMQYIWDNLLPDTQNLDVLIAYAAERGIDYNYATNTISKARFPIEMTVGDRFYISDYIVAITEFIEQDDSYYWYKVEFETAGLFANSLTGTLEAVEYIDDYEDDGEITAVLTAGTDDEDEDVFRARVLASFANKAFGGNKSYYKEVINAIDGVGACKPQRRESGSSVIIIPIITDEYTAPGDALLSTVQEEIDPTDSSGEGDGLAPICHSVQITGVTNELLAVTSTLTYDTGYSFDTLQSYIEGAIDNYFTELAKTWENTDNLIVRIAEIESRLMNIDGIIDVADTALNGNESNITLDSTEIPVRGSFNGV